MNKEKKQTKSGKSYQQSAILWEIMEKSFILLMKIYVLITLDETYECKIDTKGRLPLPASLKKQLTEIIEDGFVLKRSVFQPCLELYPKSEWTKVNNQLNKLNRNVKKNVDLIRFYKAGLKIVEVDANGRIQISKDLISFAGLDKEIVLTPNGFILEIWDKESYEKVVDISQVDIASLTEEVLGGVSDDDENVS